MTQTSLRHRAGSGRRLAIVVVVTCALCSSMVSACGSSGSSSSTRSSTTTGNASTTKPSYCASLTSLEQSVKTLAGVRPAKNGTQALKSAFTEVANQASALAGELKSEFSTQTAALKQSLDSLSSTVKEVTSSPSKANLSQVSGQVAAVSTAVKNLAGAASPKCG